MTEVKIGDIPRHKIKHSHTLKVSDTFRYIQSILELQIYSN